MKFFIFFPLFVLNTWANKVELVKTHESFINSEQIKLSRADHIIGENLVNMIQLVEKGYVNKDILSKIIQEVDKSKYYSPFTPWLLAIQNISKLSKEAELISFCKHYTQKKEHLTLERFLERLAGNYCREKTLEAISREIDKTGLISDGATEFIQLNLKSYLTKKNKKNFAFFIQSQSSRPAILKKLSQQVTTYSVLHDIVPSQEVLKDILITEQITKLIQDKGLHPVKNQNVFYAEYGKMIEQGYRSLDGQVSNDKIKEHLIFLRNYLELNQDHLPIGLCLTRLNDFAKAVFRAKHEDLARDIFKYIIDKKNKEIREDSLFYYLWTYLSKNDYKEAMALIKKYDLNKSPDNIQDPRLKFWIAYLYEAVKDPKEALKYYENIINNNPLSYYAIMSVKKVQLLNPKSEAVKFYSYNINKPSQSLSFNISQLDQDYLSSLVRLRAWSKIDSRKLMKLELKRLQRHTIPSFLSTISSDKKISTKSDLHLINARIIFDSQNYLSSFRYLYEVLDKKEVLFNRALLEILYPKPYLNDLTAALKKEDIDPIVLLALIRQESVFNPLARSSVGARGLMQLMPATARRLKRSVTDKHLVNPAINIELGTKYFKGLMKRYEGNLVYVLSAYNAGEGRVERWKGTLFDTDVTILKNIESIPFLETRNYVKLIFRNIFFYKLLLEKSELTDPSEPNKIYDIKLGFKH